MHLLSLKLTSIRQNRPLIIASAIFLILFILSSLLLYTNYLKNYQETFQLAQHELENIKQSNIETIKKNINRMALDIYKLKSALNEQQLLSSSNDSLKRDQLETLFKSHIDTDSLLSQVRWIDERGDERARIDRKLEVLGEWKITSPDRLQNKAQRYYFKNTIDNNISELFVSELDLNIENGEVVRPLEPTLRVALRTSELEGLQSGVLILNYNLSPVFHDIKNKSKNDFLFLWFDSRIWFINTFNPLLAWTDFNQNDLLPFQTDTQKAQLYKLIDSSSVFEQDSGNTQIEYLNLLDHHKSIIVTDISPAKIQAIRTDSFKKIFSFAAFLYLLTIVLTYSLYRYEKRLSRSHLELLDQVEISRINAEYKSAFLANMSHEIRTPITSIIGLLDLIDPGMLNENTKAKIATIHRSAKSLLIIINDILDLSKIHSGKLRLENNEFSLVSVAENVIDLFTINADKKNIELVLTIDPNLTTIHCIGDGIRLEQILNNLVSNAIKFTDSGTVRLRLQQVARRQNIVVLKCHVTDTGIGIDGAELDRILEPFEQADLSITRNYGGTGLGLSICQHILSLMDSKLQIESQPTMGSTFSFNLKLPFNDISEPQTITQTLGQRVMVVDDNPSVCEIIKEMFLFWGRECDAFINAEAAYESYVKAHKQGHGYDLLFIDWKMPIEDGLSLASKIKHYSQKQQSSTPPTIIMVTAALHAEITASQNFSDDYSVLLKPVTISGLMELLQQKNMMDSVSTTVSPAETDSIELLKQTLKINSPPHILVVEDNSDIQSLLEEIFDYLGVKISIANNGQEGLIATEKDSYDLIFMDIQMPVMDGITATKQIRTSYNSIELPIIALSAASYQSDIEKCLEAGMNAHLNKPINVNKLANTILQFWQTRKSLEKTDDILLALDNKSCYQALLEEPEFKVEDTAFKHLNDQALIRCLRVFVSEFENRYNNWKNEGQDWSVEDKIAFCHSLKGSSANLGASSLHQLAEKTEKIAKEKSDVSLENLMNKLQETLGFLKRLISVVDAN